MARRLSQLSEQSTPHDGQWATKQAVNYFTSVRGDFGVWDFVPEVTTVDAEKKQWVVSCSFLPAPYTKERYYFEVRVDASDGAIAEVRRLAAARRG